MAGSVCWACAAEAFLKHITFRGYHAMCSCIARSTGGTLLLPRPVIDLLFVAAFRRVRVTVEICGVTFHKIYGRWPMRSGCKVCDVRRHSLVEVGTATQPTDLPEVITAIYNGLRPLLQAEPRLPDKTSNLHGGPLKCSE